MIEVSEKNVVRDVRATPLVARQPICERNQQTFAYELLFRNSHTNAAQIQNAEAATAQVIVNSFLQIGFDRIIGGAPAFINVTDRFILSDYCRALPKDRVVFEILEDTVPSRPLMEAIRELSDAGYRFALDDYTFQPQMAPFLTFCSFVKVDLRQVALESLPEKLPGLGRGVQLLAEKVETIEEFEFCKKTGFHYFQGYFFCRPKIVTGAKVPHNRIVLCRLLAKLHQPDISTHEVENIVGEDLALSYRLLRYINSAAVPLTKMVQSINHAVRLVGTQQIRLLASLILLTDLDEKPRELMTTSLIRGKMCELLARRMGHRLAESFFTVGLFSTLDAFLDCTMEEALELLPLAADIRDALLSGSGEAGKVLKCVLSHERAEWDANTPGGLSRSDLSWAYIHSVEWADTLLNTLGAAV